MGTMTMFLTESFSSFHFEGNHFVAFYLIDDLRLDGSFNVFTDGQFAVGVYQEDFSELYFVSGITRYVGDIQCLIFLDLELLAGYFYNCEHKNQFFVRSGGIAD